jgi:outer membrane protein TolC
VLRRADDLLRQLERRHELGDLAFVEVLRARRDRNEVELLAVAADREVLAARARLASFGR